MPKQAPFSLTQGMTFEFEDNGQRIHAWFSHWSGREVISVNGQAISSKRQFGKDCTHPFRIGADDYSVRIKAERETKGACTCTLSKNGVPCQRQRLTFARADKAPDHAPPTPGKRIASFLVKIGIWFVVGLVFAFSRTWLDIPALPAYTVLAVVIVAVALYRATSVKRMTVTLEEVDASLP